MVNHAWYTEALHELSALGTGYGEKKNCSFCMTKCHSLAKKSTKVVLHNDGTNVWGPRGAVLLSSAVRRTDIEHLNTY